MAITDIAAYAHLSEADIEALGYELDAIRRDIEDSRGERDAAYIQRTIKLQRTLDVVGRLLIGCTRSRAGWALGTATLAYAKSVENMGCLSYLPRSRRSQCPRYRVPRVQE